MVKLEAVSFDLLLSLLRERGYQVIGPTIRDGCVVCDEVSSSADLPVGWADVQSPGNYRLEKRTDNAFFSYSLGPQGWKRYLFPPTSEIFAAKKNGGSLEFEAGGSTETKAACIGVRPCELAAMALQDRIFNGQRYFDPGYMVVRKGIFVVAVNCERPGATCFCTSMGTGPAAREGYDVVLTEILNEQEHFFLVEPGSPAGEGIVDAMHLQEASPSEIHAGNMLIDRARDSIRKSLDTTDLGKQLYNALEHPRWENIGSRCLGCANCTMVCPTCFCTTVEDSTDLKGLTARRVRKWDSCFSLEFSYIHGGSIRSTVKSRYRQWLTHKFSYWVDQFGMSGCVGCGRCITWCPVGIDVTEEIKAIRGHHQTNP